MSDVPQNGRHARRAARADGLEVADPDGLHVADSSVWEQEAIEDRDGTDAWEALEPSRPVFRPELHGLRALAITLVAVYHIWLGRVSGGVDVFLFLSAFFLTGTFWRRIARGAPLAVPRYWLRTFKRLVPPAAVTIIGVLALAIWVLAPSATTTTARQAVASILYVQNIELARAAVDYYAQDASEASPLQHFWSLSIQGQIFLAWPVLMLAGAIVARRRPIAARRVFTGLFAAVLAASLVWSIIHTKQAQEVAYFSTLARVWEFAAGSLLALVLTRFEARTGASRPEDWAIPSAPAVRALVSWTGVLGLLLCGIVLDVQGLFPGWIAIWPLGAAALVVLAGHSGTRWGADALLSTRPVAFLGDISYALYLVHWPLLLTWLSISDQKRAGLLDGLVLFAVAILAAWVLTRAVDAPIRRSRALDARWWASSAVIVTGIGATVAAALVVVPVLAAGPAPTEAIKPPVEQGIAIDPHHPGVRWTGNPLAADAEAPIPGVGTPMVPEQHVPACNEELGVSKDLLCRKQAAPDGKAPTQTIMLVGDSHSAQYISGVIAAAKQRGWEVYYIGKPGCPFTLGATVPRCASAGPHIESAIDKGAPDLVITLDTRTRPNSAAETYRTETAGAISAITAKGIPVLALRDNPRWMTSMFDCAYKALRKPKGDPASADAACGAPLSEKLAPADPQRAIAPTATAAGVVTADPTTDVLCPNARCSPVIGNVIVYRDADHLTMELTTTMGLWFDQQIPRALAARPTG